MSAIITAILALITEVAPQLSTATAIGRVLDALITLVPAIRQEYRDLMPTVKNIIAALRGNPATTAEQLATLDELDAQADADFDKADADAQAEDQKAGG